MNSVEFHQLQVADIEDLTDDSVAITFSVPQELHEAFSFIPGQHVTVRAIVDGRDVRRSYSICTTPEPGRLRIGVKRLEGGVFSTYATRRLRSGDTLGVAPPVGDFTLTPDAGAARHLCAIAAGSGITPVLSMASSVLEGEPQSRFTLVFGNRAARTVMFLEALEALKDRFPDRFHLIYLFSREAPDLPLFGGRIDGPKLDDLFATLIDPTTVDRWLLCGPVAMVEAARAALAKRDVPAERIADELFFAGAPDPTGPPPPAPDEAGTVTLKITLGGRSTTTTMRPNSSVLDAALAVRHELPFSCKGGMCATCKGRLIEGEVEMAKNYALVDAELEAGFVLTCQSRPLTDSIEIDYDV